ncbi:PD-(D/E)XK nuclease family protein [Adhaeribacter aquaticus]|uniref:PD-(D/E)XK nuclease family protein n=1 Tax=Adhaeribacter aquaticus TaxID=299567 RepID=UPI00041A9CB2|nr:PD-(D/E)XK nuclease family protein [Adhaeribacter aquaticus]
MKSFLQTAAEYIYQKYAENISQICIVLPTRRASIYFKNALAQVATEGIWSPEVSSMEDFVTRLAKVEVLEPIHLQLDLFDILQDLDPNIDFDQYVTWASTLLEDFSRMDYEVVDTAKLFEYVSQAKALERWDPKQAGFEISPLIQKYFKLWDNLEQAYIRLRQKLKKDKQAYTGMAYRLVADNIEDILQKSTCQQFIFLGLNALTHSEEIIIRTLLSKNKAEVLFDSDDFYMEDTSQNRAGNFLRRYKKTWKLEEWKWQQNYLLTDKKEINAIAVANASMQGKIAGQILQDIRQQNPAAQVAIVLPDETMLLPVLHSIPEEITDYNVTMGLTFKGTPLYNLIDLLFELHLTGVIQPADLGYKVNMYHHLTVQKILSHPFIRRYEQYFDSVTEEAAEQSFVSKTLAEIIAKNKVLLSAKELLKLGNEHALFKALFQTWRNCDDIIAAFYSLIDLLKQVYQFQPENPIETEYLYIFYTLVQRLDSIFDCREQRISVRSFKKFLYENISTTRLPFSGEPISDIQVMGFLETRALDFENLIILSVNENVLPAPKKHKSLMPYDVLRSFGLPTYAEQESITSYYFYRLLQRAKRIHLLYVLPSDTYGSGEKSRFILQLQHHLVPANPNITFRDLTAIVEQQESKEYHPDIIIQKDEQLLASMKQALQKGLYPSHLNMYLNCSLQYYFYKIAGIKETEEIEEQIGADQFGNIVHKVLEDYFKPFWEKKTLITAKDFEVMQIKLPQRVKEAFKAGILGNVPEQGMNFLLLKIATQVLEAYLKKQTESKDLPLQILSLEQTLETTLQVNIGHETIPVKIAGKADRIDRTEKAIRVIDYKTGMVAANDLKIKTEDVAEHLLTDKKYGKVRQLWLYKYLMAKKLKAEGKLDNTLFEPTIEAGIISFRNLNAGLMTSDIAFEDDKNIGLEDFMQHSEKYLSQFIQDMLNPEIPIKKTQDLEVCQYCVYRGICAR